MNIDPKSETQKPDFEAMAKQYALRLVDEHEGTPQYICYLAGLEDGSHILQSENQRLTEEIKKLLKRLDGPKPKRKCPNCNSTRIVVFTSDDDICLTCNKVLPGE